MNVSNLSLDQIHDLEKHILQELISRASPETLHKIDSSGSVDLSKLISYFKEDYSDFKKVVNQIIESYQNEIRRDN